MKNANDLSVIAAVENKEEYAAQVSINLRTIASVLNPLKPLLGCKQYDITKNLPFKLQLIFSNPNQLLQVLFQSL